MLFNICFQRAISLTNRGDQRGTRLGRFLHVVLQSRMRDAKWMVLLGRAMKVCHVPTGLPCSDSLLATVTFMPVKEFLFSQRNVRRRVLFSSRFPSLWRLENICLSKSTLPENYLSFSKGLPIS